MWTRTVPKKTPVVLHRAILGSLDRFMAYLIEETKGKFPTWLAPVQVKVLPFPKRGKALISPSAAFLAAAYFILRMGSSSACMTALRNFGG